MGKTIFFSTHILADVAEICTRVGIIEAGVLVASRHAGSAAPPVDSFPPGGGRDARRAQEALILLSALPASPTFRP